MLFGAVAVGVVVAAALVAAAVSRGQVAGDTPAEQIASICRLADERPWGAADAIAAAAGGKANPSVRKAALIALGRFTRARDRGIVDSATTDAAAEVRAGAALTLGVYGDGAAADRLGKLLATDPDEQVRLAAVTGVGRVGGDKAIVLLAEAMENNDNAKVQSRAMVVLLRQLKLRHPNPPDPGDKARWGALVRKIRGMSPIQDAFKAVSAIRQDK